MEITAVVVTYNRLACLKKALCSYSEQTYLPKTIIVVDNCSSDGTVKYLDEWEQEEASFNKIIIKLPENKGGAGGFHAGMKKALETNCDWIWVSDDDAYLKQDTFEKLYEFSIHHKELLGNVSALCTAVVNNNKIVITNRGRIERSILGEAGHNIPLTAYTNEYFDVDIISFVGTLIRYNIVKEIGLPHKEYFIYNDDGEYSVRLREKGHIYCVPASLVEHIGGGVDSNKKGEKATWRDYYATRNLLLSCKEHKGKKAFYRRAFRRFCAAILSGNPKLVKIYIDAIKDAMLNNTGVNVKYAPNSNK